MLVSNQCDDVNQKMLNHLETEKHVISCTDEIDERQRALQNGMKKQQNS